MKKLSRTLLAVVSVASVLAAALPSEAKDADPTTPGRFLDELLLKDIGDGRNFELLARFRFLDSFGITWVVPTGEVVNGASIPGVLWSIIGGPWSGKYRRASVIHDFFFRQRKYDSGAVHRVFYDAMLADGVSRFKAKLMYYAVVRFNDSWVGTSALGDCGPDGKLNCRPILADEDVPFTWNRVSVHFDQADLDRAEKLIEATDLPLEEIDKLARARREAASG